jgi:hypothetical protein
MSRIIFVGSQCDVALAPNFSSTIGGLSKMSQTVNVSYFSPFFITI